MQHVVLCPGFFAWPNHWGGDLDGLGILVQPSYIVYDDIVAGRLVPVLDDWDLPRLTVNLAYPSRKHLSAKVRTFIDFMAEHFARMDYERKWTGRFGVY